MFVRNLKLVIYLPGYAGNFIRFLMSLDDSTYPIHLKNTYYDSSIPRKKLYSYKNLFWKHKNWDAFEQSFISPLNKPLELFLAQTDYNIATINLHPGYKHGRLGYYGFFYEQYKTELGSMNIDYMQVALSAKYKPVIVDFLQNVTKNVWRELPLEYEGNLQDDKEFREKFNPYQINLDMFLLGIDSFVDEYELLCKHTQLPAHTDDAIQLYKEWYKVRRFETLLKEYGLS